VSQFEVREPRTVYVENPSQALPALASFFIPGLGQLIQGRVGPGLSFLFLSMLIGPSVILTVGLGLVWAIPFWIWCIVDAAKYRPRRRYR